MSLPFSQQVTADATCRLLQAGSGFAAHVAVGSVLTGQVWGAVAGTAGTIAMEALGRASGCYNNPDDAPGFEPQPGEGEGCKKVATGEMKLFLLTTYNPAGTFRGNVTEVGDAYPKNGYIYLPVKYSGRDYWDEEYNRPDEWLMPMWRTELRPGATCGEPAPGPEYPVHNPNDPIAPPYEFYDPETQCAWKVTALDSYLNSAGEPVFYWRATSNNPSVCGGPYYWWGNGQEPNVPAFEDPRGPDVPPRPPTLPPGPGQDVNEKLDEILRLLRLLLECACPEEPVIKGQFRTISFRSDETSPFGKSRLRKRLRYRGSEGVELSAVVDHWRDFSWQSGAVRVQHLGASWGAPSVWSSTADEGKRVLRHAAREAGIDPNQVGRWSARGSDSSRLGVSDTMRVDTTGGYYWITARDGSDQRPIVART